MNHASADELVGALVTLAATHNVRARAFEGCKKWLRASAVDGPDGLGGWSIDEVEPHFVSCSLVFEHGRVDYPFVDTRLELCVRDESGVYLRGLRPVGSYRLITCLDGVSDDDYFVIEIHKTLGG